MLCRSPVREVTELTQLTASVTVHTAEVSECREVKQYARWDSVQNMKIQIENSNATELLA